VAVKVKILKFGMIRRCEALLSLGGQRGNGQPIDVKVERKNNPGKRSRTIYEMA